MCVVRRRKRSGNNRRLVLFSALIAARLFQVVERFLKKQKGKKLCAVSPHALVNECRARVPTLNIQLTSHAHSSPDSESSKEELVLSKHGAQRDFIIRAEATEYGVFFLPDVSGYGPLFVSALQWAEDQSKQFDSPKKKFFCYTTVNRFFQVTQRFSKVFLLTRTGF